MCIRAVNSSFTTMDMKFFSFGILVSLNVVHFLRLLNVQVLFHQTFFAFLSTLFLISEMNGGIEHYFFNCLHKRGIKDANLRFLLCSVGYSMRE